MDHFLNDITIYIIINSKCKSNKSQTFLLCKPSYLQSQWKKTFKNFKTVFCVLLYKLQTTLFSSRAALLKCSFKNVYYILHKVCYYSRIFISVTHFIKLKVSNKYCFLWMFLNFLVTQFIRSHIKNIVIDFKGIPLKIKRFRHILIN